MAMSDFYSQFGSALAQQAQSQLAQGLGGMSAGLQGLAGATQALHPQPGSVLRVEDLEQMRRAVTDMYMPPPPAPRKLSREFWSLQDRLRAEIEEWLPKLQ